MREDTNLLRERRTDRNCRRIVLADHANSDAAKLAKLSEIASGRTHCIIDRALAAAREELGMEVAFVSAFAEQRMVFRKIVGDAESFGWREGKAVPLDDTFCRLLVEGRLPNIIPDAESDGRVRFLDVTGEAGIGSYVGVPIRFSDGHLYGTLCALSHSAEPPLKERDAQFVRVLARLVAEQLEREGRLLREATLRTRAHERRTIGRELHDRVSHALAVIHQSLQLYEAFGERDPDAATQKLELAKRMTREAMEETRDLSLALRADESGRKLKAALSELLEDIVPPGMSRQLSVVGDEAPVSAGVRNAFSHSGAATVTVAVTVDRETIVGVVEDDGRGFDRIATDPAESGGLASMSERTKLLGGACSVESAPGEGTRVEASFSLDGARLPTRWLPGFRESESQEFG